jgi:predicted AlkP superfamily phosphohydrolase/phosphomutase
MGRSGCDGRACTTLTRVLVLLNFDSASRPLLERLIEDGRLPVVRELFRRGTHHRLETPATYFPAGTYPSLYLGRDVADHGLYYPLQWSHGEQRVRHTDEFPAAPAVWERVGSSGTRVLLIDPYEAREPEQLSGLAIAGWQFRNRIVLPGWSRPHGSRRHFERTFGRAPAVDEVFGTPSLKTFRRMRRDLLAAPERVATLTRHVLAKDPFDLLWLTFSATHLAGHQFWDLSALVEGERETARREGLEDTVADVYAAVDAAIGQILEALPEGADIILFSALGMGPNTSRVDLLPDMLSAVLSGRRTATSTNSASNNPIWRLRAAVPTRARASIANALPRRALLEVISRLEVRAPDWSQVRAFTVPSDGIGYIRLNLRGRERDGVVHDAEVHELEEQIADGLLSYTGTDGRSPIAAVERLADVRPGAARAEMLPDLLVRWNDNPATQLDHFVSPKFGDVRRVGGGSGRSGNHTDEAWAVVIPGTSRPSGEPGQGRVVDIAATICDVFGADRSGLTGEPLLTHGH